MNKLFAQSLSVFISSKSNWLALSMIAIGITTLYSGDTKTGIEALFGGLALLFGKDAIVKTGSNNE